MSAARRVEDPRARRYSSKVVGKAREHFAGGWTISEIIGLVERDEGQRPAWHTVKGWVDPGYAERHRRRARGAKRRYLQRKSGFKPVRNVSPEWKLARMRDLHDGGLSFEAIGVVAGVWWGEPLPGERVASRLRRNPAKRAYRKTKTGVKA